MKPEEIYQFESPREILVRIYQQKADKNPSFSIRAWSRKLGFNTPAFLAQILNGKRNVTVNFGLRIAENLELNFHERTYFETLVFHQNAASAEEKGYFNNLLKQLRPESNRPVAFDQFVLIKDWYYGVIDEMACLKDFREDYDYIASRLGHGITPRMVSIAIEDLIRLGSLVRASNGKLTRPQKRYFIHTDDMPENEPEGAELRKYQKKYFEKLSSAIDEQSRQESLFRMTNFPIKTRHITGLIKKLEEFFDSVLENESAKDADDVYQFSLQFLRLTQPLGKRVADA